MLQSQFGALIKQGSESGFNDQKSRERTMPATAIIARVQTELYLQFVILMTTS